MEKLCDILGTPSWAEWPDAYWLADRRGIKLPNMIGKGVDSVLNRYNVCPEAIDLVIKMLRYNPKSWIWIYEVLKHPYFTTYQISPMIMNHVRMGAPSQKKW